MLALLTLSLMSPTSAAAPLPALTESESVSGAIELVHAPAKDSLWATTVTMTSGITGADLEVYMNGEPVPEMYLPQLDLTYEDELSLRVEELYLEAGASGPTEWLRRYAEIAYSNRGSFGMEDAEGRSTGVPWEDETSSPLAGALIRITSDGGELTAEPLEGPSLPEGLGLDLSFAGLLPGEAVAPDDEWTVEGDTLAELLEPGGELDLILAAETRENLFPEFDERSYEGELTLRLIDHAEGRARIELSGEMERITTMPGDLSPVPVVDGEATDTVTETWTVSGELLWSTEANALSELVVSGSMVSDTFTQRDPDLPGPTYESTYTIGGEWRLEVRGAALEREEAGAILEGAATR